jgi:RND family efflux transporter MFP subunit
MRCRFVGILCTAVVVLGGCGDRDRAHEHGENEHEHEHEGPGREGHDHHGGDHDGAPTLVVTHFSAQTELFVEFPALIVGRESPFAAHLTRLADYAPVSAGKVTVVLRSEGAETELFSVESPSVPGIFRPVAKPTHPGPHQVAVLLESAGLTVSHELGELTVFESVEQALLSGECEVPRGEGSISYLKEQQWKVDFGLSVVERRSLRVALAAYGTLRARSSGEAHVVAPFSGRVATTGEGFPKIGDDVELDQTLVVLAPRLDDAGDRASLELEVQRARLDLEHAKLELERLEGLFAGGAVAERRVVASRSEVALLEAELKAANRRLGQSRSLFRPGKAGGRGGVKVRAPIAGTVTRVDAAPGAFVDEGQELFHVADLDRLWLEARVSEADLGRLGRPTGAWFEAEGDDEPIEIPREGLVTVGGVLDPQTRTVPVIFELANSERRLRVGVSVRAHVVVGEPIDAVAVPVGAILREEGQDVVMVMAGGESFERRPVRLGIRDSGFVQVLSGLEPGERVVSTGAYSVRLAGSSSAIPTHGHAH